MWEATDPDEYVSVSPGSITEEELKARGVKYYFDDDAGVLYAEKSGLRKITDYTIRAFATPVTVVVDAATTIVVVGSAVYMLQYYCPSHRKTMTRETDRKLWKDQKLRDIIRNMDDDSGLYVSP